MAHSNPVSNQSSTEFGPDSGGRIKGLLIVKPLVYGNMAKHFGKKREEDGHTHEWTAYVKPYNNEDMSTYVKKVHFKLHESYANQNRIITKPPYEVTETGWGEFEIVIKIFFHDPNERPVTLYHILKLFQTGVTSPSNVPPSTEPKLLVSESYDELLFQDPSALMQQLLTNSRPLTLGSYKHDTDFEERIKSTTHRLGLAQDKIANEMVRVKNHMDLAMTTYEKFKKELSKAQSSSSQ